MSLLTPTNGEDLGLQATKEASLSVPSAEINIESIHALEKQIKEHEKIIIKLKRARNSLLNVYKLPPEVLGDIFRRNVTLKDDFGKLEEGSHNFLLVCHHWFEVALRTPEIWSFWGNTPTDWARWHRRSGTAPLDLVLGVVDYYGGVPDTTLCDVLRDRAARDTIRRIHLRSEDIVTLSSIISLLTGGGEGVQSNSVESFILSNYDDAPVDISNFFAHYRFPKLQRLKLDNCAITSWDLLTSRTTILTSLTLHFSRPSPTPTTPQLFSILTSNPSLQEVSLSEDAVPTDSGGESPYHAPLHHLKELGLDGDPRHVFRLINQLNHPTNTVVKFTLFDCTTADVLQIVGPYLRDYLRRRSRSRMELGLSTSRLDDHTATMLHISDVAGIDLSTPVLDQIAPFVVIAMWSNQIPQDQLEKGVLDLVAYIPQDEVVSFHSWDEPAVMDHISPRFPNLRALHSGSIPITAVFSRSNLDKNGGISTSLRHLILEQPILDHGDWLPLTYFVSHRSSSWNRLDSLTLKRPPLMRPQLEEYLRGMVREFRIT